MNNWTLVVNDTTSGHSIQPSIQLRIWNISDKKQKSAEHFIPRRETGDKLLIKLYFMKTLTLNQMEQIQGGTKCSGWAWAGIIGLAIGGAAGGGPAGATAVFCAACAALDCD